MKVLVLGGGGREHALAWRLQACPSVEQVVGAPGNPGIAAVASTRSVDALDPRAVVRLATSESPDLVVVGPEAPLAAGVTDALADAGFAVFGPSADAARIEGSKSFAKQVMADAGVPTADAVTTDEPDEALQALDRFGAPYVVKADGLAAGKGVTVTSDREEAERAVRAALVHGAFGEAGRTVVVEEHLRGPECSVLALCDGQTASVLPLAEDYKRAFDADAGPNTGGMGARSPVTPMDHSFARRTRAELFEPVLRVLAGQGLPYVGVLYAGLVLTERGPMVLEFNARFGDPEAQVVLPRVTGDVAEVLLACAKGRLEPAPVLGWAPSACVTVVLASGGYPGAYTTGRRITGVEEAESCEDVEVFHAGTRRVGSDLVTAGGRVLCVTGRGVTVEQARTRAYAAADRIHFEGLQRRDDIAAAESG